MNVALTPPISYDLAEGPVRDRRQLNIDYLMSLRPENLLRPYLFEAGLWSWNGSVGTTVGATVADGPATWHWGWEAPTSQLRGHILGHWLSAASWLRREDPRIGAAIDVVVAELARCQDANGGEWLAPFGTNHLDRIAEGRPAWAPQYVLHKLFAGLLDAGTIGGNTQALAVLQRAVAWFHRWSGQFDRDQLDDILDVETGGMLEVWAGLYGLAPEPMYLDLMCRYRRGRLFDALLRGEDVLTGKHANTQIPEILGCARAYEVTGDPEWRRIVEAFWDLAVTQRGTYVTGGSTSAELWQPIGHQSARLHDVQEHCTVANLMRLADYLHRWTGDARYAAHWERNFVNGNCSQQHRSTGMVSYFLPLGAGSRKTWGSPTSDFWCCHGTLLQAHTDQLGVGVHSDAKGVRVDQYLSANAVVDVPDVGPVRVAVATDVAAGIVTGQRHSVDGYHGIQRVHLAPDPSVRPDRRVLRITVSPAQAGRLTLTLRVPDWTFGEPVVTLDGQPVRARREGGLLVIEREWSGETVELTLGTRLEAVPLVDQPGTVAFVDGGVVLVGISDEERRLMGDVTDPSTLLQPDEERRHSWWNAHTWRTLGQDRGMRFMALNEITDEAYTVYFPVEERS